MRFAAFMLIGFNVLLAQSTSGQSRFDQMQREVFTKASDQWLVSELKAVHPAYFDCTKTGWVLPAPGVYTLFGDTVSLTIEQINRFREIWFPLGDCKRFVSIIAMADVYMPLFKRKTEQLSLHADVAYLPVLLSGCNQQFNSGDGAGLWAMPFLAARRQHLKIDTLVDERLGGDFTTDAALKHFAYLLSVHRNDYWRTVAAYYSGPAQFESLDSTIHGRNILAAINTESADLLRFLAYTNQLLRTVHLDNQLTNCFDILGHFQPVMIEKPLQVKAIASVLSIDEDRLRYTNPVYTGEYLMPGYRKVPFVLEDTLVGRFQQMKDSIARWQPKRPKAEAYEWETYTVQHRVGKGETLGRIAGKYHVTIAQIKKWNKLRNDKIRKGQLLRIEQRRKVVVEKQVIEQVIVESVDSIASSATPVSDSARVAQQIDAWFAKGKNLLQQKKYKEAIKTFDEVLALDPNQNEAQELRKQAVAASSAKPPTEKPTSKYYTVKSGDSLWSIARKYPGVTEHDLMKWNKCGENIRPGQRLVIKK
jgi:membrane-bound lytic murein transglycosylase D